MGNTKGERIEGRVQIVIMLAVGLASAAGSFTHVAGAAAEHGQAGWLAWADAITLELMSVASGLEMRRRKRQHRTTRGPFVVLLIAVTLSLGAQILQAEQSPIGWIAAAIPALGFLAMAKMALGRAKIEPAIMQVGDTPSVETAQAVSPPLQLAGRKPAAKTMGPNGRVERVDGQPLSERHERRSRTGR